jgi:hypothetical protein
VEVELSPLFVFFFGSGWMISCTMVLYSPQLGQRPISRGDWRPHFWQT